MNILKYDDKVFRPTANSLFTFDKIHDIPPPYGWWRAGNVDVFSDRIGRFIDLSGKGNDILQGTHTSRPYYIPAMWGGHPVARFAGGQHMSCSFGETLAQPNTMISVWQKTGTQSGSLYMVDGITSIRHAIYYAATSKAVRIFSDPNIFTTGYTKQAPFLNPIVTTGVYKGAIGRIYENKILMDINNVGDIGTSGINLGSMYNFTNLIIADFAELLIYDYELTETEITNVADMLMNKYLI